MKGCPNEPDFGMFNKKPKISNTNKNSFFSANLSALVYQHTLMSLALPIKLVLPNVDIAEDYRPVTNQQQETKKMSVKDLLEKGAGKIKHRKNRIR